MSSLPDHDALPAGTRLGEFEVQRVLGAGGFGIVYLAFDHALERLVAIKEYLPGALAARGPELTVVPRAGAHAETYALGLRSFVNEARMLARFDHPSLVKVHRFWEAHGTAYMVMPYYQGRTLHQVRRDMAIPPDESWLRRLITPLLGALECLHREQVYHRDIAPDNILLLDDDTGPGHGRPVLLDLGAARRVIGGQTQALTAIVKPSFAPIEQYAETSQLRQGPWTDLYALAAVVHFCLTGRPPVPATSRTLHDELTPLHELAPRLAQDFGLHYSGPFVQAVDHALAVHPMERPESVAAWREELAGIVSVMPAGGDAPPRPAPEAVLPQTVLVRTHEGALPEGHAAVDARAYATTAPAAGVLHSPVTVPLPRAGRPQTSAQAGEVAGAAVAEGRAASPAQAWTRWAIVGLVCMAMLAFWWGRHSASAQGKAAVEPAASVAKLGEAAGVGSSAASAAMVPASKAAEGGLRKSVSKAEGKAEKASAQVASKPERSGPLNPRAACSNHSFIMLAICMKRHCSRPAYTRHPECQRMREQEAAQRPNYP
ncbi:serine/threonine-protein kinase [Aquabacterium sp.]|uniref:serine/threonine protein kinase n=1 Tax=Aquabacterium sp. TaxID=1872578 RepID=UPI0025C54906|nr:serine/threonine-protein kinase [Aquabacterium sp.]